MVSVAIAFHFLLLNCQFTTDVTNFLVPYQILGLSKTSDHSMPLLKSYNSFCTNLNFTLQIVLYNIIIALHFHHIIFAFFSRSLDSYQDYQPHLQTHSLLPWSLHHFECLRHLHLMTHHYYLAIWQLYMLTSL